MFGFAANRNLAAQPDRKISVHARLQMLQIVPHLRLLITKDIHLQVLQHLLLPPKRAHSVAPIAQSLA